MPDDEIRTVKLVTQAQASPSWTAVVGDWLKIFGGVILGAGGVLAAVAQYQVSEAKNEAAEQKKLRYEEQIVALQKKETDLQQQYAALTASASTIRQALDNLAAQAGKLSSDVQAQLASLDAGTARIESAIQAETTKMTPGSNDLSTQIASKRVFLQIAAEEQRPAAEKIKETLLAFGCSVPGIQNVNGRGFIPAQTEIRYFRYPQDRDIADTLLKTLVSKNGLSEARISYVDRDPAAAKTGQIEIWFNRQFR